MKKRILFVDDEPHVLDALRALLRPLRNTWEMEFVDSGARALAELERAAYDVIVSDMRMPGMDGATLLRHAQQRHPHVVRIVLSGYTEFESALRTVPVAHQFLVKPCDPKVLENVIERACALQTLVRSGPVAALAGRPEAWPSLPQLYLELTEVLTRTETGVAEVAGLISKDPAVVTRVLQLVNSALLGLGREVASVDRAILYLGTNMIKNLALAVQVFNAPASSPEGLFVHRVQRHSLLVGTIARRVAEDDRRMSEDAFIAGILHDIGKVVLVQTRREDTERTISLAREGHRAPVDVETDTWGVTHAELGGFLLAHWGLPYPVIEAAANHHAPQRVSQLPGLSVLSAVYVANVLAHEQAQESGGGDESYTPLDEAYLESLGLLDRLPAWREIAVSCTSASRSRNWAGTWGDAAA